MPTLNPPYHDPELNRQPAAMLTTAAAAQQILYGAKQPGIDSLRDISTETKRLPEAVKRRWRKAEIMRETLFDPSRSIIAEACIFCACCRERRPNTPPSKPSKRAGRI